jgi:excisionase family DNA binding protein
MILDSKWDGRATFTVSEAAEILGIGRGTAYQAVKDEKLPVLWFGKRCVVPRPALERLLQGAA